MAIQLHFEVIRRELKRKDEAKEAQLAYLRHIQRYQYFSVASGCFLALASLALCAFSIHKNVDITPLAWLLGPLAGLAGVFIWGYRPSRKDDQIAKSEFAVKENVTDIIPNQANPADAKSRAAD